jgi:hypothetical protein
MAAVSSHLESDRFLKNAFERVDVARRRPEFQLGVAVGAQRDQVVVATVIHRQR